MKKVLQLLIDLFRNSIFERSLFSFLTCGSLYALPVGNPSEANLFLNGAWLDNFSEDSCGSWNTILSFRLGYYGDYVFNRHLTVYEKDEIGSAINETELFTSAAYLVLNISERADLFATLGSTKFHIKTDSSSFSPLSFETELFFKSAFSWSLGGHVALWQRNCFLIGLEGQYFQTMPQLSSFLRYDTGALEFPSEKAGCYQEWQIGLGMAYRFSSNSALLAMVPYVAVTWSGSRFDLESLSILDTDFPTLCNNRLWGLAIGTSLTLFDVIGLTIEGRWASEKALYINNQFRF